MIHSEKPQKTNSPFLIAKCLTEAIGPGYKACKMANGDLLLELHEKKRYDRLYNLISFGDVPVTVTPMHNIHGVVSEDDLMELTETELLKGWRNQNQCEAN